MRVDRFLVLVFCSTLANCGPNAKRVQSGMTKGLVQDSAPEEHCDADGWCIQKLPGAYEYKKMVRAIWAASTTDVWAVGSTIARWDGQRWRELDGIPGDNHPRGALGLKAVYGINSNAVWAVGEGWSLFWDGTKFTEHVMPIENDFDREEVRIPAKLSVYATAIDDVWVVSRSGQAAHWDGQRWATEPLPSNVALLSIYCARKDDCWAAGGEASDDRDPAESSIILHWDGYYWDEEQLPAAVRIFGLSGTASDDVWAVGPWGRFFHYDGRSWAESPSLAKRTLFSVFAVARNDVWATGEDGMVLHYDGKEWSAASPTWRQIRTMTGTKSSELWALVDGGIILHWHGATYRPKPTPPARLWGP